MWETVQSIVIGLLAPGGVWLGWLLQRRDKATEHTREKNALLRQKAEEIYAEIEAVRARSSDAVMAALEYAFKNDVELSELMPNLGRLKALVNMYFPKGGDLFGPYETAVFEPVRTLSDTIAALNADPQLALADKNKKMKDARVECAKSAARLLVDLLGNLTTFMHGEAPKLV